MPACQCPVHDLQWGIPICRSAYDALMAERRLDVVARFDRYGEASLFCLACAAKVDVVLAAEQWAVDDDAENFFFEGYLLGDCVECLAPRLAAVGLPSLQALLDDERQQRPARAVKPPTPYELSEFASYFRADGPLEAATPAEALDAYIAERSPERRELVANLLDAFLAAFPDDPALERAFREKLYGDHLPGADGHTLRAWLRYARDRLR